MWYGQFIDVPAPMGQPVVPALHQVPLCKGSPYWHRTALTQRPGIHSHCIRQRGKYGHQHWMQLKSAFSLAASLTTDFVVDLFVDGGNVTEEELLETLLVVWCDECVEHRMCNAFSGSNTFV